MRFLEKRKIYMAVAMGAVFAIAFYSGFFSVSNAQVNPDGTIDITPGTGTVLSPPPPATGSTNDFTVNPGGSINAPAAPGVGTFLQPPAAPAAVPPARSAGGTTADSEARKQAANLGFLFTIVASIAARALALAAVLVDFALNFGNSVLGLEVVHTGWRIVLNFANLGFVLAIIVMAFATIFQMESYGMKKTLWKLVVAALLVNFSLVIAGSFISVSTRVTNVFMEATTVDSLSNALANAMQPQQFIAPADSESGVWTAIKSVFNGDLLNWLFSAIASLFFAIIFTLLAILVFFALFVMLLVRAIALIFLLIVSPIVWLFWIFPYTQKYWKQWWEQFMRWNFFAPAVMFFVYLTVVTAKQLGNLPKVDEAVGSEAAKSISASLMMSRPGQHAAELFVISGMLFGGIYVANMVGIMGGGLAITAATGVGKGVKGWAGRKAVHMGTRPLRGKWGVSLLKKAQSFGVTESKRKNQVLNAITLGALPGIRQGAAGLSRVASFGGERMVADQKKKLASYDKGRLADMIDTLDESGQIAALQILGDDGSVDLLKKKTSRYISEDMQKKFERNNIAFPVFNGIQRVAGFNWQMLQAATSPDGKVTYTKEVDGKEKEVTETLAQVTEEFVGGIRPSHIGKMEVDELFSKKGQYGMEDKQNQKMIKEWFKAAAKGNADSVAAIIRGSKGSTVRDEIDLFREALDEAVADKRKADPSTSITSRRALINTPEYERLRTWLGSSGARNLGFSEAILGIPPNPGQGGRGGQPGAPGSAADSTYANPIGSP